LYAEESKTSIMDNNLITITWNSAFTLNNIIS
jgi:hypothetical protein